MILYLCDMQIIELFKGHNDLIKKFIQLFPDEAQYQAEVMFKQYRIKYYDIDDRKLLQLLQLRDSFQKKGIDDIDFYLQCRELFSDSKSDAHESRKRDLSNFQVTHDERRVELDIQYLEYANIYLLNIFTHV